jgi:hypothetical protein
MRPVRAQNFAQNFGGIQLFLLGCGFDRQATDKNCDGHSYNSLRYWNHGVNVIDFVNKTSDFIVLVLLSQALNLSLVFANFVGSICLICIFRDRLTIQ